MRLHNVLLVVVLWSAVLAAHASGPDAVNLKKPFADQANTVRKELSSGTKYSEISQEDRARVLHALTNIEAAIADQGDAHQLPPDRKVAVFNDQELINTILTKAREESRLICSREKSTGSHRSSANCQTVAERRRLRDQSERDMGAMQRRHKITNPNL